MNTRTRLAAVATAIVVAATIAAPAQAEPGDVTLAFAPTAVLAEGTCVDHAFTYEVELPDDTTTWSLDVDLIGPDGDSHSRQLIGSFNDDDQAGDGALQLCSLYEPLGTYRVFTTVDYKVDGGSTVFGTRTVQGRFQAVGAARTKASLKAVRNGARIVTTSRVRVSTGEGFGPVDADGPVVFQKLVGTKWRTVDKVVTNAAGVARGSFRSVGPVRVRAVFKGMGEAVVGDEQPVPPATSKTVRVA